MSDIGDARSVRGSAGTDPHAPRRFGFLHLPRTGGTSLERLLQARLKEEFAVLSPQDLFSFPEFSGSYRVIAGHIPYFLFEQEPSPRQILTLLRAPGERLISFYNYILSTPEHYAHRFIKRFNVSLAECLEHPALHEEACNLQTRMLGWSPAGTNAFPSHASERERRGWFDSMLADYAYAEVDDACLQTALTRLQSVIRFGLLEDAERAFADLYGFVCGEALPALAHENRTPRGGYRVTDKDREAIAKHNALDLLLYEEARRLLSAAAPAQTQRNAGRSRISRWLS